MRRMQREARFVVGLALFSVLGLVSGCASKQYVTEEVQKSSAKTEKQLNDVESQVEQTQTKLKEHDDKIQQLDKNTQEALDRAQEAGKLAQGKFVYQMVLSDDKVHFPVNKYDLSDPAREALDGLVDKLKNDNKNVYLEIQGHTDSTGPAEYNMKLGQERADAVRRYLNSHGVALNRMNTISYGETQPVADNKTRDGRAKNRRVVIVVMD
jgi:peptidoglycan-associated lipoprotein